jgi:hypothetical protein
LGNVKPRETRLSRLCIHLFFGRWAVELEKCLKYALLSAWSADAIKLTIFMALLKKARFLAFTPPGEYAFAWKACGFWHLAPG